MATSPGFSALSNAIRSTINPRVLRAAAALIQAAAVKEIATNFGQPLQDELVDRANLTISSIADDWCGTNVPVFPPKPWPGPSSQGLELATVVFMYANTVVQSDSFRTALTTIVTDLVKRAYKDDGIKSHLF